MLKKFFKDGLIYTFGNILTKFLTLLLLPLYTKILTPTEYGVIDLYAVLGNLINLTIALEICQAIVIYYIEAKEKEEKIEYASTAIIFYFTIYTVFLGISFIFPEQISNFIIGIPKYENVFKLAAINIYFSGLFYFFQIMLRSNLQARSYATISIFTSLAVLSSSAYFVLICNLGIYGSFYGFLASNILGTLMGFYFTKDCYKLTFNVEKLKKMLKFSIPLVPSSVGVFLFIYIDRILIKQMMTTDDLGIYGVAFKFASMLLIILGGFQTSVTPLIYESHEEKDTPSQLSQAFSFFCYISFLLISFLSIFSFEIVTFFTSKNFIEAYKLIPLLSASVVSSLIFVFAPGLAINKKTKDITFISIFCGFINTLLNFILIPTLGLKGSALATLLSSIIMFSLYVIKGQKLYKISYEWNKIMISSVINFILYFISLEIREINLKNLFIKLSLLIFSILATSYIFIDKSMIKKIREKIKL